MIANARTRTSPDPRLAYGLAGYAVVAAHFGLRFGTLSLARPFDLDLSRIPERSQLLVILYAGHSAEAARFTNNSRLHTEQSSRFLALAEALAGYTGALDALDVRRARLTGGTIVKQPGDWEAVGALAERLMAGETLGYLTARQVIRSASASPTRMQATG